jgi:putative ABC transport system permease protein
MKELVRDARFGLRLLAGSPGFTSVAVLALALGIAASTAIFSVVYATLLAPLPYPEPDQLVMVWSKIQGNKNVTAAGDYLDWKRESRVFQHLNAWTGRGVSLATGASQPEQVQASVVTPGFYTMVGDPLLLGRDFLPEEGEVGKDQVVILTHRLWQQRFGGDRAVVGREIRIDGKPYTVVGIMAPGLADRGRAGLSLPLAFAPDQINHDFHWLLVMGRLKPGISLAQANADMATVTGGIAQAHPASNQGWGASVELLQNNFLSRDTVAGLWMLLGAVGFVLLIACANVANLMLARGTSRQREIAVRASLGAGRRRIFQQMLVESVVLAAIGGVLGVVLAQILLDGILAMMPANTLPTEADVQLNLPVLLFTFAVSVGSGVLFGCMPAWQATRLDLSTTLKEEGRSMAGGGRTRLRQGLVVAELALALTLLAGGGLAVSSLVKLIGVDLGFRTEHLLTFSLPVPSGRLPEPDQIQTFYAQLVERIQAVPGVASASVSTGMPVAGTGFGMPFTIVGKPVADRSRRPGAGFNMVTPEYFRTFGLQIEKGRAFTEADRAGGVPVAVVNATFVKRYLPGVDPLSQRLLIEQLIPGVTKLGPEIEWQIVGVYRDVRNGGPGGDAFPEIDVPFAQSPWPGTTVAVQTAGAPGGVASGLAAVVKSLDPDLPMADVKSMDQMVSEATAGARFTAVLFGTFAAMALLLAAVGIYGVMSFVVATRTHEIGLRMALGAGRAQVLWQVLREGMTTALLGTALGTLGALAVGRAMKGMFYGVGTMEPVAFASVVALLLASAVLACLVPARRAASVDPMTALRQD